MKLTQDEYYYQDELSKKCETITQDELFSIRKSKHFLKVYIDFLFFDSLVDIDIIPF